MFFGSKIAIYLSLGLHKGCTSYKRSLQKRTFSTSKQEISSLFLYLWVIFALLDPNKATQINANPDPDPQTYMTGGVYLSKATSPPKFLFGVVKQFCSFGIWSKVHSVGLLYMLSTQPDPLPFPITNCINTYPCTYSHREGGR
jgi:hypothetical protein